MFAANNYTICVIGNPKEKPQFKVNVNKYLSIDGLGQSSLLINFNAAGVVTYIDFDGRPALKPAQLKQFVLPAGGMHERCHLMSVAWIKEELCQKHTGQNCIEFYKKNDPMAPFRPASYVISVETARESMANKIASLFLDACRKNIFIGSKAHNNFTGKMALLLIPYISRGKEGLSFPFTINFPKTYKGDQKFGEILYEEWGSDSLEISTWEQLLEIYFACNYDESNRLKKETDAVKATRDALRDKSQTRFLTTYEKFGAYDGCRGGEEIKQELPMSASSSSTFSSSSSSSSSAIHSPKRPRSPAPESNPRSPKQLQLEPALLLAPFSLPVAPSPLPLPQTHPQLCNKRECGLLVGILLCPACNILFCQQHALRIDPRGSGAEPVVGHRCDKWP